MKHLQFIDEYGSFSIEQPENTSYLYFPLASETGLKSSLTPNLGGDSKTDQETFLLEPVSAENLHNNRSVRNFWLVCENGKVFSAAGAFIITVLSGISGWYVKTEKFSPRQVLLRNRKHQNLRIFRITVESQPDSCGIHWKGSLLLCLLRHGLLLLFP